MRWVFAVLLVIVASITRAETIVPVKTIRAGTILTASDIAINANGPKTDLQLNDLIGMETRVVLYAGRPIRADDVMPPALVQRNQIVPLVFQNTSLSISTYGRALDRGAEGDIVRVMNLASRTTLFGVVTSDGTIRVSR